MTQPKQTQVKPQHQDDTILGKAYDPQITRRLITYLRPYWSSIIVALSLMTVATIASVIGPYLIKIALDEGVSKRDVGALGAAVGVYVLSALIFWLGTYLRVKIMAVTGQSIIYDMRTQLFAHLQTL